MSSGNEGQSRPHLELGAVSSQVALLQERVQDIVRQLSSLSQTVQGIMGQYYGVSGFSSPPFLQPSIPSFRTSLGALRPVQQYLPLGLEEPGDKEEQDKLSISLSFF